MRIEIREASIYDACDIARIHSEGWRVAYKGIVHPDVIKKTNYDRRYEYFSSILGTEKEENHVALVDGDIVAFITIGDARDNDLDVNSAEIWGIYVDPERWGESIGKQLMNWAEGEFISRGKETAFLWTMKDNIRARRFYEGLGYTNDDKEKTIKLIGDIDVVRYCKCLYMN